MNMLRGMKSAFYFIARDNKMPILRRLGEFVDCYEIEHYEQSAIYSNLYFPYLSRKIVNNGG